MKKNKSKRLEPVLQLAKQKEDVAAKLLGDALDNLDRNRQQYNLLQEYRNENQQQIRLLGQHGATGDQLQRHQLFLQQIESAIAQQSERLNLLEQQVAAAKRNWQQLHFKRKAVNEHIEKIKTEEVKISEKKIQTEMDDRPHKPLQF